MKNKALAQPYFTRAQLIQHHPGLIHSSNPVFKSTIYDILSRHLDIPHRSLVMGYFLTRVIVAEGEGFHPKRLTGNQLWITSSVQPR